MKKIFFAPLIFFTLHNIAQPTDTINWRSNYKLKWEDFKGRPDTNSVNEAVTSAGITYDVLPNIKDSTFTIKVFCYFNKQNSWTKITDSKIGLKHEQGHFDITELFARHFRMRLKNKIPKKYSFNIYNDINQILDQISKELSEYHDIYDEETNYCNNVKLQVHWSKKIAREINKLNAYK